MIGLNDPRLADDIMREVDARIDAALEQTAMRIHFGIVDAVDESTRKVAVDLLGSGQPSPGFAYGETKPLVGDRVAVAIKPDGARMVLRVLSRESGRAFAFFVGG